MARLERCLCLLMVTFRILISYSWSKAKWKVPTLDSLELSLDFQVDQFSLFCVVFVAEGKIRAVALNTSVLEYYRKGHFQCYRKRRMARSTAEVVW